MSVIRIILALVALSLFSTGFTDISLNVTLQMNPDGTAHVIEESRISLDTQAESEKFTNAMSSIGTTIDDWKKLTGSQNIKYHTNAVPSNVNIAPRIQYSIGIVTLEYDASEPIFDSTQVNSRKTQYSLDQTKLSFQLSKTNALVIPQNTLFNVIIPHDAKFVKSVPQSSYQDGKIYTWRGPYTIAKFEFIYERQQSLGAEVSDFFHSTGGFFAGFFSTSMGGISIIIILLILIIFGMMRRHI